MIGTTPQGHMRWTNDTQMSLDLVDSLIDNGALDADDVALRWRVTGPAYFLVWPGSITGAPA